ncbi:MAG: prepilin-type N-terminal cleavage/methylation domain-containing protein, partial [Pseudomonadales bacterium]|nr:prepilin-type N-terminal cleavage/methylation domain-containing protein [Pseudomonadales bacterium]
MTASVAAKQHGFSLLELMITVAIIAILSGLAFPIYQDYIQTSQEAVLSQNIDSMRVFQEDFRLRTGAYSGEDWSPGDGPTETGWLPDQTGGNISYVVTANAGPPLSYTVVATDAGTSVSVTRT